MPNARARLAPTTSMISAPTIARTICVSMTAASRRGDPARRGRRASAVPKQRGDRQAHGGMSESGAEVFEQFLRCERLACRRRRRGLRRLWRGSEPRGRLCAQARDTGQNSSAATAITRTGAASARARGRLIPAPRPSARRCDRKRETLADLGANLRDEPRADRRLVARRLERIVELGVAAVGSSARTPRRRRRRSSFRESRRAARDSRA